MALEEDILMVSSWIKESKHPVVFTGAGMSAESGIPPFRGPDGLWSKHDPSFIELGYFLSFPARSWQKMKEIFFDFMCAATPNAGHQVISRLAANGYVKEVITQNIDGLHQKSGIPLVHEYHGTINSVKCMNCFEKFPSSTISFDHLPPYCSLCGGILKPDFIFFNEPIAEKVNSQSFDAARRSDVMLVIGTTGEVMPAALIPRTAKDSGSRIVEINTEESAYTDEITDIFLQGKAGEILNRLEKYLTQPKNES